MEGDCHNDGLVAWEEPPRCSLRNNPERAGRVPPNPLRMALSLIVLGGVFVPSLAYGLPAGGNAIDINEWDADAFDGTGRNLQVYDALAGNSYAIYGTKIDAMLNPDHKTMAKKCFSGLGLRGCKIRQSFLDEAGDGWLVEESAELNSLLEWDDDGFVDESEEYW